MKTIETKQAYQIAKEQLEAYENARLAWCIADGQNPKRGTSCPSEVCKSFPFADIIDNDLRSAIEVYEFINDPPKNYFVYINAKELTVTTWTGQRLGTLTFLGPKYRDNFGGQRQSVSLKAINGFRYSGTYYTSSGDYARIKINKPAR